MAALKKSQVQKLAEFLQDKNVIAQINRLFQENGLHEFQVEFVKVSPKKQSRNIAPANIVDNFCIPTPSGECPPECRKVTICTPAGVCRDVCIPRT